MILSNKYGFDMSGLKAFYLNRILRIYPTYLTVMVLAILWQLVCYLLTHGTSPIEHLSFGLYLPNWQRVLFIATNFTLLGIDIPYLFSYSKSHGLVFFINRYSDIHDLKLFNLYHFLFVPQAWSISAELCFYMIAPFACFGKVLRVLVLGTLSLIINYFFTKNYGDVVYFFWPATFYLFAAGIISFKISAWVLRIEYPFFGYYRNLIICGFSWIFLIFVPVWVKGLPEWIFLVSLIFLVPILFKITKNNKIDRFLGGLSYPIYCVHILMFELCCTIIGRFHLSYALLPVFVLISSIFASITLHHFVEEKIDRIRTALSLKVKRSPST